MNTVGSIVKDREVFTVQRDQTVLEAVKYMVEKEIGAVAVLEAGRLVGIFSERDLMKRVIAQGFDPQKVLVEEVMTRNIVMARPEESYASCLAKMQNHNIRHLVIASEDRLLGVISLRDLMIIDIKEKSAEIEMMNAYLHYVPPRTEEP
ncbi:MAG: CBS domain-containing protein [candidate division KSB1 bacterium]|nr:CBS domain-containing protein [candidate division KSB1 bacterium]MDZ7301780.1 CBS domain-containing protein [candidate division KSB1 bacterium]MDZ7311441.1 CBS domain-containing protein [candidate division KSB1 bacterium]